MLEWVCRHVSPTTLARRPAKVWSELLRWLVLMMQKLWISRRTTEESSQTSRRSAPVRRARLPSKYHDQLDDVAWVSGWAPRLDVNHPMRPTPGPRLITVLVSSAEGGSAQRKRSEATPAPLPRAVLFYTLLQVKWTARWCGWPRGGAVVGVRLDLSY